MLTESEQAKVKISDLLEMHEFGMIEEHMGNALAAPITDATLVAALEKADEIEERSAVELWLKKQELHRYVANE